MPPVRIVCISDTHGQHAKLSVPDGDILIHAGDFMAFGDAPKEIINFNHWLGQQSQRFKVVIAGDHDLIFASHRMPRGIFRHVTDIIKVILGDTLKNISWRLSRKRLLFCH